MSSKVAAIDIGTNTFHLLIVEWDGIEKKFNELIRKRFFVKLGAKNLFNIDAEAYQRGLIAMEEFALLIEKHQIKKVIAYGTSAIRNAENASQFIKDVHSRTKILIEKISGDKEAELIFKGIKLSYPFREVPDLIMDIGGGSVEFIIADQNKMHYAQSFKIGVTLLKNQFHTNEPISLIQINELKLHLQKSLQVLINKLIEFKPKNLIGASGTFDVLENLLPKEKLSDSANIIKTENLKSLIDNIVTKTLAERKQMKDIPLSRVDLIVVAFLLIEFIWGLQDFKHMVVTKYSMKEGMIQEAIESNI